MCAGAIFWSGISRVVFALTAPRAEIPHPTGACVSPPCATCSSGSGHGQVLLESGQS
jgi:tRNA(Arg) A34 adenosine deaminase TadA